MLKQGLTFQILNQTDHCPKELKTIQLMEDELVAKMMKKSKNIQTFKRQK